MLVAVCPPRPPPAKNTAPAEKKPFSRCEERKERSSAQMQLKEPAPRTMLMRSLPQTFSKRDCEKEAATREQLPSEPSKLLLGAMPAAKLPRWARWCVPRRWNHCRRFLLQLLQCEKVDAILFINDPEVECALLPCPTAPLVNCEQDGEKGSSACESDDDARRSGSQRVVGDDDEYDNDTAESLQEERIDLQERHGVYEGAAFVHAHLAVKDHVPLTLNELDATADLLAGWIDRGKRVYVHCKAGKARSAMAVCALMLKFAKVEVDGNEEVSAEVLRDEKQLEHDGDGSCEQEIGGRLPKKMFRPCSVDEALAVLRMRRPATRKLATKPDKYEAMLAYADRLNRGSSGERFRRYRYRHVDVATSTWSEDEADDQACSSSVENLPFSFVLGVADVVMEAEAEKSKGNCCGDRGGHDPASPMMEMCITLHNSMYSLFAGIVFWIGWIMCRIRPKVIMFGR
eukprot:g2613.t1